MRIDLISPVLPPTLDGIGDHTVHLAEALAAQGSTVRVLTAQRDWTSLSGVRVRRAFHRETRRGVLDLVDALRTDPPDWVLLQFEQFSYGRWGLNPFLPLALSRLRHAAPETQIAVMFHETYTPLSSVPFALMSLWQRPQFWALGRLADTAFFSTEPWAENYRSWFPDTDVRHLPVGSNIPTVDAKARRVREQLEIAPDAFVLGLFGSAHPSRLLGHVNDAVAACARAVSDGRLLYVGPDGDQVRAALTRDDLLVDAGPLPAEDVSRCLAAMDLYLAPFEHGVSTRRGSFLAGLQHGLPTVSTRGSETGPQLRGRGGTAFELVPWSDRDAFVSRTVDLALAPRRRERMGRAARDVYTSTFDWPEIAQTLRRALEPVNAPRAIPAA